MKKLLLLFAGLSLAITAPALPYNQLINGVPGTNTAAILANGLTNIVGSYLTQSTNAFNLSATVGTFANTNQLPALPIIPCGGGVMGTSGTTYSGPGYPYTLYGPFRQLELGATFNLTSSNLVGINGIVLRFAATLDGTYWQSNWFIWPITNNAGASLSQSWTMTNVDTFGVQGLALQEVDNLLTNGLATNLVLEVAGKPGL